ILRNGFYLVSALRRIRSGIGQIAELSNRQLHGREIEIGRRLMAFSALTRKSRSGISHSSESLIVEVIGGRRLIWRKPLGRLFGLLRRVCRRVESGVTRFGG